MNIVVLRGNLTRDMELVNLPTGVQKANLRLAVSDGTGEARRSYFFTVIWWGPGKEDAVRWALKGAQVQVVGRITTREYTNRAGVAVTATEIAANSITLMREAKGYGAAMASANQYDPAEIPELGPAESDVPF